MAYIWQGDVKALINTVSSRVSWAASQTCVLVWAAWMAGTSFPRALGFRPGRGRKHLPGRGNPFTSTLVRETAADFRAEGSGWAWDEFAAPCSSELF